MESPTLGGHFTSVACTKIYIMNMENPTLGGHIQASYERLVHENPRYENGKPHTCRVLHVKEYAANTENQNTWCNISLTNL